MGRGVESMVGVRTCLLYRSGVCWVPLRLYVPWGQDYAKVDCSGAGRASGAAEEGP